MGPLKLRLKCVVLEDRRDWLIRFRNKLRQISDGDAECSTVDEAVRSLALEGHRDLYLIDLNLDEHSKDSRDGLGVIQFVREHSPASTVVAYSTYMNRGEPERDALREQSLKAGAHEAVGRDELSSMADGEFCAFLERIVEAQQREALVKLHMGDDLRTKAVVEELTQRRLETVLRDLFPAAQECRVEALSGGLSGDLVLAVTVREAEGHSRRCVVKVSRNRAALAGEFRSQPPSGAMEVPGHPKAGYRMSRVVGDWQGFESELVKGRPLADFLEGDAGGKTRLFAKVLNNAYFDPVRHAGTFADIDGGEDYALSYRYAAGAVAALHWLSQAQGAVGASDRKKAKALVQPIEEWTRSGAWIGTGLIRRAVLHGDLHPDNVLVAAGGNVVEIDFARRGVFPRLFDIAALDADLILRRYDRHDGREWRLDMIDSWERWVLSEPPFARTASAAAKSARNGAVRRLRSLALGMAPKAINGFTPREYAVSLLFQCVRYLRFPLPIGKKVLAVRTISHLRDLLN